MKLTKIALSLLVVAGAAITGGSWYTGKQVEEKYQELVVQGNQALKPLKIYGVEVEIKNVKLDRGIFSSSVNYQLETKIIGETVIFEGHDRLFHGPLPLNRLKQMNFAPVMLSSESQLNVPESLKEVFENKVAATGQTTISYAGDVEGLVKTSPFKSLEGMLQFGAAEVDYRLNKDGKGKVVSFLKNVSLYDKESDSSLALVEPKYTFSITDQNDQYGSLYSGDMDFEAKSYDLRPRNKETAEFDFIGLSNPKSKGYAKLNGERYESAADFSGEIQIQKDGKHFSLGKLSGDMFLDFDAKSFNNLMQLNSKVLDTLNKDEETLSEVLNEEAQKILTALMTKAPKLHIKSLSLENTKGKGTLDFILNLAEFDSSNLTDFDKVLKIFKESKIALDVNKAFVEETIKNIEEISGESAESAAAKAKETTDELVEQAKNLQGILVDDNSIKLKLELNEGKVKLNDKEMSDAEVQSVLFMLMMSLGGMGL